jgi:single-strand selective monofunctional uracil DNA glycosylase
MIGIGAFAEARSRVALTGPENACLEQLKIGRILHPSPASPLSNRGWPAAAEKDLMTLGIDLRIYRA